MYKEANFELIPVSTTKFIVYGYSPEVTYEFILDDKGEVIKYRMQQEAEGVSGEAERIK